MTFPPIPFAAFLKDEYGAAGVEYVLLVAAFAAIVVTMADFFGATANGVNADVATALKTAEMTK